MLRVRPSGNAQNTTLAVYVSPSGVVRFAIVEGPRARTGIITNNYGEVAKDSSVLRICLRSGKRTLGRRKGIVNIALRAVGVLRPEFRTGLILKQIDPASLTKQDAL